jgi:AcrR family transcriptional regulator
MDDRARLSRSRAEATRARMLETAEALMARHGIDGVSSRQIASATGQGNKSALQYHFGDKRGLMAEIISRRVASFEPRRRTLLQEAEALGRLGDARTLLGVIFRPIAEATDAAGRHVYAGFLLQFLTQGQYEVDSRHPGWGADSAALGAVTHLARITPALGVERLGRRLSYLNGLFLNALVERDNARAHARVVTEDDDLVDELLTMMAAALQA